MFVAKTSNQEHDGESLIADSVATSYGKLGRKYDEPQEWWNTSHHRRH